MRILIAEDDRVSLRVISAVLEKADHKVVPFATALEAIEFLKKDDQIDLVVSDIMMPGMDGYGFLKFLRNDKRFSKTPVILCTTLKDKDSVIKGGMLGADDYIAKPINAKVLLDKIERLRGKLVKSVLVVDDEETFRSTLAQILRRHGFRVIGAATAYDALQILNTNDVNMVITDIRMPNMTGLQLMDQIRENHPRIKIILMDNKCGEKDKNKFMDMGAIGFICKPFNNTEILSSLEKHF